MALYVYITKNCEVSAKHFNVYPAVLKLKERVEKDQRAASFELFHGSPYVVKKKVGEYKGRLIAEVRPVDDDEVLVFHELMIRSGLEYEIFRKNPGGYNAKRWQGITDDELRAEVARRQVSAPVVVNPSPSAAEQQFIYEVPRREMSAELLVHETREWKDFITQTQNKDTRLLAQIADACIEHLEKVPDGFCSAPVKNGWTIEAYREGPDILLLTLATDDPKEPPAEKIKRNYEAKIAEMKTNRILRLSRRAYPFETFLDDSKKGDYKTSTFYKIETDPLANMALSPEEAEVLQSARAADGFPLFINGRAGSGKSTILLYLFADIVLRYLKARNANAGAGGEPMRPPVYLTASGELLRVAKETVKSILTNELAFLNETELHKEIEATGGFFDALFREFQPLLLSMTTAGNSAGNSANEIAPENRKEFLPQNRVDYAKFQQFWRASFGHDPTMKHLGPDICWHVIRSYIKGMISEFGTDTGPDVYLRPDDYAELPENQKTVSIETYKEVYEKVYEGRYKNYLETGVKIGEKEFSRLWDDQDLAKYILDNDLAKPIHPAVFCDEAQDFTRIELELLLRINLFSHRSVPPQDISKIPVVFAGDPFQTLNPTGFRWDAIKAFFVEKFILALDPAQRARIDLNYRELSYNYRSTPPIVRFANTVQAFRSVRFDMREIKPQIPWTLQSGSLPVVWFDANDAEFWKKFDEIHNFIVIVPCNEGEEAEFVKRDKILSAHIKIGDDGVPHNVLSAVRAKGREYPAVITYGFGRSGAELGALDLEAIDDSKESSLPLQYFINRLYVAVSRPKQQLIIVETAQNKEKLWRFATEEFLARIAEKSSSFRDPENPEFTVLEPLRAGDIKEVSKESAGDALENARAFAEEGRNRNDAFLLRQAMHTYLNENKKREALECLARALEIEKKHADAAEKFADLGLNEDAARCYWRAGNGGLDKLIALANEHAEIIKTREYQWASQLRRGLDFANVIRLLDALLTDAGKSETVLEIGTEPVWAEALNSVLVFALQSQRTPEEVRELAARARKLSAIGAPVPAAKIAELFFRSEDYKSAIAFWEKSGQTKTPEYTRAKAEITAYPDSLSLWSEIKEFKKMLALHSDQQNKNTPLNAADASLVAYANLSEKNLPDALSLSWLGSNFSILQQIAQEALSAGKNNIARQALESAALIAVVNKRWDIVLAFGDRNEFVPTPEWKKERLKEFVEDNSILINSGFIRALARSNEFTKLLSKTQDPLRAYLRNFLQVRDAIWRKKIAIEEAGAALERGGKFTDAISFYEAVYNRGTNFSDPEKNFARKRWALCKKRQLEYEVEDASAVTGNRKAKEFERDINAALTRWAIPGFSTVAAIGKLPQFPELEPLQMPACETMTRLSEVARNASIPAKEFVAFIKEKFEELGINNANDYLPDERVPAILDAYNTARSGTAISNAPAVSVSSSKSEKTDTTADDALQPGFVDNEKLNDIINTTTSSPKNPTALKMPSSLGELRIILNGKREELKKYQFRSTNLGRKLKEQLSPKKRKELTDEKESVREKISALTDEIVALEIHEKKLENAPPPVLPVERAITSTPPAAVAAILAKESAAKSNAAANETNVAGETTGTNKTAAGETSVTGETAIPKEIKMEETTANETVPPAVNEEPPAVEKNVSTGTIPTENLRVGAGQSRKISDGNFNADMPLEGVFANVEMRIGQFILKHYRKEGALIIDNGPLRCVYDLGNRKFVGDGKWLVQVNPQFSAGISEEWRVRLIHDFNGNTIRFCCDDNGILLQIALAQNLVNPA